MMQDFFVDREALPVTQPELGTVNILKPNPLKPEPDPVQLIDTRHKFITWNLCDNCRLLQTHKHETFRNRTVPTVL